MNTANGTANGNTNAGPAAAAAGQTPVHSAHLGDSAAITINTVTVSDGTIIAYKDWGRGKPVVFSHGWPLQGDAWENQMLFLAMHGYRVVAHDRRGHGLSSQPWTATTWTPTRTIWLPCSTRSTSTTSLWSAIPLAAAKWRAIWAAMAAAGWHAPCWSLP